MKSEVFVPLAVILITLILLSLARLMGDKSLSSDKVDCIVIVDPRRRRKSDGYETASETLLKNGWDYHVVSDSYPQSRWSYDG